MDKKKKSKAPKASYTSKGQRRSSMKTSGWSDLFINNRDVKPGWTPEERAKWTSKL